MRALAADLSRVGIGNDTHDDLLLARWQKLVWNVPMSGLSVILNADTQALITDPHTCALAEAIMCDVIAGARACGRVIRDDFAAKMGPYQLRERRAVWRRSKPCVSVNSCWSIHSTHKTGTDLRKVPNSA